MPLVRALSMLNLGPMMFSLLNVMTQQKTPSRDRYIQGIIRHSDPRWSLYTGSITWERCRDSLKVFVIDKRSLTTGGLSSRFHCI